MTINVPGLVSIVTFYLLILVVGIWAGWKNRGKGSQGGTEQVMLAGRDMGTFVGILTMTGKDILIRYKFVNFIPQKQKF
jgi:high affinity choline transporter 7